MKKKKYKKTTTKRKEVQIKKGAQKSKQNSLTRTRPCGMVNVIDSRKGFGVIRDIANSGLTVI